MEDSPKEHDPTDKHPKRKDGAKRGQEESSHGAMRSRGGAGTMTSSFAMFATNCCRNPPQMMQVVVSRASSSKPQRQQRCERSPSCSQISALRMIQRPERRRDDHVKQFPQGTDGTRLLRKSTRERRIPG
ncbi:unnamed protein product [Pleuronectes platessa]|uniref:Uncharacterized protein n=1 Tax=Pleuronectes platessa TaxID=8262 RepID=A0A9N7YHB7_PLEPL|nr:unnamed protein product [Pleuronectes platessa]